MLLGITEWIKEKKHAEQRAGRNRAKQQISISALDDNDTLCCICQCSAEDPHYLRTCKPSDHVFCRTCIDQSMDTQSAEEADFQDLDGQVSIQVIPTRNTSLSSIRLWHVLSASYRSVARMTSNHTK
jgi:hypothetical protein